MNVCLCSERWRSATAGNADPSEPLFYVFFFQKMNLNVNDFLLKGDELVEDTYKDN